MKKRIISLLMAMLMLTTLLPVQAFGATVVASGECGGEGDGSNLTWTLGSDGLLTISGSGAMADYTPLYTPWQGYEYNIEKVVIQNGVTAIGSGAFAYCEYLTDVTIPANVTMINGTAFYSCGQLGTIRLDASNSAYTIEGDALFTKDKKTLCWVSAGVTGTYSVPEGVTMIGEAALSSCNGLTGVTIPASVTGIGYDAFALCEQLADITVSDKNTTFASVGGVVYTKDQKTLLFAPCGITGTYTIPAGVTSVANSAFFSCVKLTGVTFPESLTTIDNYAFSWCSRLQKVDIPSTVRYVGTGAFSGCGQLTAVNVAANHPNYTSVDGVLFSKDKKTLMCVPGGKTDEYIIPDSVTYIAAEAFAGCDSLTSVVIPNGITSIGESAFWECGGPTSITIPASVTSIGDWAFDWCDNLTDIYYGGTQAQWNAITIGDGNESLYSATVHYNSATAVVDSGNCGVSGSNVTWSLDSDGVLTISGSGAMKDYDFNEMPWVSRRDAIKRVVIKEGVTSICDGAFWQCENVTDVELPDSLRSIGGGAFGECISLKEATIPAYVTWIGEGAFGNCKALAKITVATGNTAYTVNNGALYTADGKTLLCVPGGKTGAYTIPSGVTTIAHSALAGCEKLTGVTIPDDVTSIGSYAFAWCRGLESITIPAKVTLIDEGAFASCYGLAGFNVAAGNTAYVGSNGGLFTKDMKTLLCVAAGFKGEYHIPETVTAVKPAAFDDCGSLTSVVIPDGVPSIGDSTFWQCSSLKSITIPASVTSVGMDAFYWCNSLTDVYYGGDKTAWNAIAIDDGNEKLTSATIHYKSGVTVVDSGSCGVSGSSVNWTLYSNGLMSISGSGAMKDFVLNETPWTAYNSSIRRVVIGEGVTSVGYIAFGDCGNLSSVAFPSSLRKLGDYAFSYCSDQRDHSKNAQRGRPRRLLRKLPAYGDQRGGRSSQLYRHRRCALHKG